MQRRTLAVDSATGLNAVAHVILQHCPDFELPCGNSDGLLLTGQSRTACLNSPLQLVRLWCRHSGAVQPSVAAGIQVVMVVLLLARYFSTTCQGVVVGM